MPETLTHPNVTVHYKNGDARTIPVSEHLLNLRLKTMKLKGRDLTLEIFRHHAQVGFVAHLDNAPDPYYDDAEAHEQRVKEWSTAFRSRLKNDHDWVNNWFDILVTEGRPISTPAQGFGSIMAAMQEVKDVTKNWGPGGDHEVNMAMWQKAMAHGVTA